MAQPNPYGLLLITEDDPTPRKGWAYIEWVEIDPEWIFKTHEFATRYAGLQPKIAGFPGPTIVPVIVEGTSIRRA